jgi:hypothetical protein
MPDTPEHRADMHALARDRQRRGLPVWDRKIDLKGILHNDELTFEQRRDEVARRLRASGWLENRDDRLTWYVSELAGAVDATNFDLWFSGIYDIADEERVWIATF